MSTAFSLPIWVARCRGNKTNCLYPDFHMATDVETLKKLVANDHTFICFKNNYRDEKNFKYTDTLLLLLLQQPRLAQEPLGRLQTEAV